MEIIIPIYISLGILVICLIILVLSIMFRSKKQNELYSNFISNFNYTSNITPLKEGVKRIKLICNFMSSKEICDYWNRMSKGNYRWNDIEITWENKNIDYYVIINKPPEDEYYDVNKTILFRMEPGSSTDNLWNDWYTDKNQFMVFSDLLKYRNNSEWHLLKTYNELKTETITKTKVISAIVSSQYERPGHKFRINLLKYIQRKQLHIDIYGRDNKFNFKNYLGRLPDHNKDKGIFDYKYTVAIENCQLKNYFTEKIIDAILGECLCFYWGCPNITMFLHPDSYILLDEKDFKKSYNIIINSIKNNEWEKRINIIRKMKNRILDHYNFFPRIEGMIYLSHLQKIIINLPQKKDRLYSITNKFIEQDIKNVILFPAVDGKKLIINDDIKYLFRNYHHGINKGVIGCALSHIEVWKKVANSDIDYLVLEDDITIVDNFNDLLGIIYREIKDKHKDFDCVFTGYNLCSGYSTYNFYDDLLITFDDVINNKNNSNDTFGFHCAGAYGYILSPKGAKKLLDIIDNRGMFNAIDYFMLDVFSDKNNNFNVYCSKKQLTKSNIYLQGSNDTNIQHLPLTHINKL